MSDMRQQLRSYVEATIERIDAEDISAAQEPLARRRFYLRSPLGAFAVAAVAVMVALGSVALLRGPVSDPSTAPAETIPPTTVALQPEAIALVPAVGIDPVRISTVIGDVEFTTMEFPAGYEISISWDLLVTPYGPVAVNGTTLWWSTDYETWHRIPVEDGGGVVLAGDDVVVGGVSRATRFRWERDQWIPGSRIDLPGPIGSIDWMAFGPRGAVAASSTTVYYSADGVTFTEAERGPDLDLFIASDMNPENTARLDEAARMDCRGTFGATESRIRTVRATDGGFVAFTSATHPVDEVCAPLLWFSADGRVWDLVSPESPFGERPDVTIVSIAEHNGRFVAVGVVEADTRGFVWVSDDALTWNEADLAYAGPLFVDGGDVGWVLTGAATVNNFALWFSADGYAWDGPHPLPEGLIAGYALPLLAVGSDTILALGPGEDFNISQVLIGRVRPNAEGQ